MFLLIFSNVDILFANKKLTWRTYTIEKALPITYWIKFINGKKFAKAALDENIEAYMVNVSSLGLRITIL